MQGVLSLAIEVGYLTPVLAGRYVNASGLAGIKKRTIHSSWRTKSAILPFPKLAIYGVGSPQHD